MPRKELNSTSIWRSADYRSYLGASGFAGMALAMQQLLLSWILIGILQLPAHQVGLLQALIGVPGVVVMLLGGASADRSDVRQMLIRIYWVAPVFPLFLVAVNLAFGLGITAVIVWGLGMSFAQAYSMPGQQAILNRIAGAQVQQAVTGATAIGFIVQVLGLIMAGQIDRVGVGLVLFIQAVALVLAGFAVREISRPAAKITPPQDVSRLAGIREGLSATYRHPMILHVLSITLVSSIFNAGSFFTVYPFVVARIYQGDAWLLAVLMAVFFAGAALSNMVLLAFQPLRTPGRLFLIMQLTRILVLALIWIQPAFWVLIVATFGWGLNMGITTNLARSMVQESAPPAFLGRILSVLSIGLIGSVPLGAIVLGWLVEAFGALNALVPSMLLSVVLFIYGTFASPVWRYRSPEA